MVTPVEIKKGLEFCSTMPYPKACIVGCAYHDEGVTCIPALMTDTLAYIKQLEEELAEGKDRESGLSIMLTGAQSAAETYKRERDAAKADINMCCPCEICTRSCTYDKVNPYDECADFEWRGLPELPKEKV